MVRRSRLEIIRSLVKKLKSDFVMRKTYVCANHEVRYKFSLFPYDKRLQM